MDKKNDRILQKFAGYGIGGLVITDPDWNIVCQMGKPAVDQESWAKWSSGSRVDIIEGQVVEWEITDKKAGAYYRIHSSGIVDEGEHWLVHHIYDISDVTALFHDLSSYSHDWYTLSSCQREIIGALSDDCRAILPIVIRYLDTDRAVLYIKRREYIEMYSLNRSDAKAVVQRYPDIVTDPVFKTGEKYQLLDMEGKFLCCAFGDTVLGDTYALFSKTGEKEHDDIMYPLYFNVFRLFIENTLLRENVTYESEHDHLTGLYTKDKYSELLKTEFPFYDSIAVFNMDLNYLKRTNDTLGHEAGNRLLQKAADSMKAVSGDDIYAFRLGGDEFLLVAKDADEEKASFIRDKWQKKLHELNTDDPEIECVIACGVVTGKKPYDLNEILEEADRLMYQDKREIKISRGEDPDSR